MAGMDTTTLVLLVTPIFLVDLVLKILALYNLSQRERVRGPKVVWALVIIFVNLFGWAAYFLFGRDET